MAELDTSGQIQEFLTVLKRRKWGIVLPMLFFLAIGSLIAVVVPKKVEVMTRVELRETRVESDPNLKSPQNNAATKEIPSAAHHIKHYKRIKEIIEGRLQDRWELDYMGLNVGQKHNYVVDVVMKNLRVYVEEKPNSRGPAVGSWFINIYYKDTDGERAEAFLIELVARWIDDVLERDAKQLEEEKETLQEALQDAEERLSGANARYTQVCKELGVNPSEPLDGKNRDTDFGESLLSGLKSTQSLHEQTLVKLETEIDQLQEDLDGMPIFVEGLEITPGTSFDEEIDLIDDQIRDLKIAQEYFRPAHPNWRVLQKKIDPLVEEKQILRSEEEPERSEPVRKTNPDFELTQSDIDRAEVEYQATQRALEVVNNQVNREESEQRRRAQTSSRRYTLYSERELLREDRDKKSQLLSDKDRAVSSIKNNYKKPYDTVQPPIAEDAPVTPNTSILVVAFAIAGLGLGLVFSLLAEYGKNADRSPHELGQVLPIPVLGAINSIVTTQQARRRHARRTIVAVSSLFILGGLAWFTYMIWKRAEDLPVPVQETLDDIRMKLL